MSDLTDVPLRFDLGESTGPPLALGDLMTAPVPERLAALDGRYRPSTGDPDLRAAVAAEVGVDPEQVLVTAGGASAMFLTALALPAGSDAVVATPVFPPARTVPAAVGLRVVDVGLSFVDGYRLDLTAMADALRPSTRLVSLASPQNPSGVRFTETEVRDLLALVDERAPDAVLLLDETYRQTVFGDAKIPASMAGLHPRVVTTSSLSKSHGAAGLRVGWFTSTDPELFEAVRRAKFNTVVCGSTIDELLAVEVLRRQEEFLAPRREFLTTALDTLTRWAADHPVDLLRPDGGALASMRLRVADPDRFHAALAQRETRVGRGSWFGESEDVVRIGFGHLPLAEFAEGLNRVADALRVAGG
ncbi:pyridoxal phosphate-dependent aminotransferase [Virgisporangium ochraceum]